MAKKKTAEPVSDPEFAEFLEWKKRRAVAAAPAPAPVVLQSAPGWLPPPDVQVARLRVLGLASEGHPLDGGIAWEEQGGRTHFARAEQELAPSEERAVALGFKVLGTYGGYTYYFRPD